MRKVWQEYLAVAVAVGAGVLYVVTSAPGVVWQDSGMIQWRVLEGDVGGRLGLALAHPLFYWIAIAGERLGGVLGLGEPARRVNVVGALLAAVGVANAYLLVRLWAGRAWPGVVAAVTLAVSHTYWRHGAVPETYNLYVALLLGELCCLVQYGRTGRRGWIYVLALLNGMAVADHMLGVLALAVWLVLGFTWLWTGQLRWRDAGVCAVLWVVGAVPYLWLIGAELAGGVGWWEVVNSALFGQSWQGAVLNRELSGRLFVENVLFFGYNFATPTLLLALGGIWWLWRAREERYLFWAMAGLMVLFLGFAGRYTVPDRYAFFLPVYALTAVLVGLGAGWWLGRRRWGGWPVVLVVLALLPVVVYAVAAPVARRAGVGLGVRREVPYRDKYEYFLQPWRVGYRGAERFGREALATVGEGAVIWADNTTVYPLLYLQEVEGLRRDVVVASNVYGAVDVLTEERIGELLAEGEVWVVSPERGYSPGWLVEGYGFEARGVVWRVKRRVAAD